MAKETMREMAIRSKADYIVCSKNSTNELVLTNKKTTTK